MFRFLMIALSAVSLNAVASSFDARSCFGLDLLDPVDVITCTASNAVPVEGNGRTVLRLTPWGELIPRSAEVGYGEKALLGVTATVEKPTLEEAVKSFERVFAELSACTNLVRRNYALRRDQSVRSSLWVGTVGCGIPVGVTLDMSENRYSQASSRYCVSLKVGLLDKVLYLGTCPHPYMGDYPARIGDDARRIPGFDVGTLTGKVTRVSCGRNADDLHGRGQTRLQPTALFVDSSTGLVCGQEARFWHHEASDVAARRGDLPRHVKALGCPCLERTNDVKIVTGELGTTVSNGYIADNGHDVRVEVFFPNRTEQPQRKRLYPAFVRVIDETPSVCVADSKELQKVKEAVIERNRRLRAEHANAMMTNGSYCGVWGVSREFDIAILHFDPCGKGVLAGFMAAVIFSWTHDGKGMISCTPEGPEEMMMEGADKPFAVRYLPDTNAMEIQPGGLFDKEKGVRPLPFMSAEPQVKEFLKRSEEAREKKARRKNEYWKDKVRETVTNRFENLEEVLETLVGGRECLSRSIVVRTDVPELADVFSFHNEGGPFMRTYLEVALSEKGERPANVPLEKCMVREQRRPKDMPEPKATCRIGIAEAKALWKSSGLVGCDDVSVVMRYGSWIRCSDQVLISWKSDPGKEHDVAKVLAARFAGRFPCDAIVTTVRKRP